MTGFSTEAFDAIREGARRSAMVLAPMLAAEAAWRSDLRRPLRVLDVGCGEGWFSHVLLAFGHDVESLDAAPPEHPAPGVDVSAVELEDRWAMKRAPYDLVLCLEVAEHLSEPGGDRLVASLIAAARNPGGGHGVIAFSAAVPGQRGLGHVNEQWPAYWDDRFRRSGWMLSDPFRERVWDDARVEPWYAQNLLLATAGITNGTRWAMSRPPRSLVHPQIFEWRVMDVDYWRERATERLPSEPSP